MIFAFRQEGRAPPRGARAHTEVGADGTRAERLIWSFVYLPMVPALLL